MKRISRLLIIVIILSVCCTISHADGGGYRDWACEHIEKAILAEIIPQGLQKDYDLNITRGEVAQLLWNVYKNNSLGDFEVIYYFDDSVPHMSADMLYSLGVVNGISEKYFGVEEEINFEQFACMLSRMTKLYELKTGELSKMSFSDINDVSPWALSDIEYLYSMGLIEGNNENKLYPSRKVTRKEAISLVWRLNYAITEEDILVYGDTNENFLVEEGYVSEEDFKKEGYISNLDALWALFKIKHAELDEYGLKYWYEGNILEKFDYFDDNTKMMLLSFHRGPDGIFPYFEDIADFNPNEDITNYEALLYVLHTIGDTYGCTETTEFIGSDDKEIVIKRAYNKGLTESEINIEDADKPIKRADYYKILHRALFVNFKRGGYAGVHSERLIDRRDFPDYEIKKMEREVVSIDVYPVVHNDLSITWGLTRDLKFIEKDKEFFCSLDAILKDGTYKGLSIGSFYNQIDGTKVVEHLKRYSDNLIGYRISYYKSDENKEYVFDIMLPKYEIREEGKEVKPGRYIRNPKAWTAKEITLGAGGLFDDDAYYLIIARDHSYRKEEYNVTDICCFMPDYADYKYIAPTRRTFGVSIFEDMRLQKVTVSGDRKHGFVITFTPESSDTFDIVEAG